MFVRKELLKKVILVLNIEGMLFTRLSRRKVRQRKQSTFRAAESSMQEDHGI